jgi:hypothetical protein
MLNENAAADSAEVMPEQFQVYLVRPITNVQGAKLEPGRYNIKRMKDAYICQRNGTRLWLAFPFAANRDDFIAEGDYIKVGDNPFQASTAARGQNVPGYLTMSQKNMLGWGPLHVGIEKSVEHTGKPVEKISKEIYDSLMQTVNAVALANFENNPKGPTIK